MPKTKTPAKKPNKTTGVAAIRDYFHQQIARLEEEPEVVVAALAKRGHKVTLDQVKRARRALIPPGTTGTLLGVPDQLISLAFKFYREIGNRYMALAALDTAFRIEDFEESVEQKMREIEREERLAERRAKKARPK